MLFDCLLRSMVCLSAGDFFKDMASHLIGIALIVNFVLLIIG